MGIEKPEDAVQIAAAKLSLTTPGLEDEGTGTLQQRLESGRGEANAGGHHEQCSCF